MRFFVALLVSLFAALSAWASPFSAEQAVYRIEVPSADGRHVSQGTGVLIARDKILTNCHVLDGGKSPRLFHRLSGQEFYSTGRYRLGSFDACVLTGGFDGSPVRLVPDYRPGESVWVFGYPSSVFVAIQGKVKGVLDKSLQISAFCAPGSSGGPVVNIRGELIGLHWGAIQYQNNECLAIPAADLLPFL